MNFTTSNNGLEHKKHLAYVIVQTSNNGMHFNETGSLIGPKILLKFLSQFDCERNSFLICMTYFPISHFISERHVFM